VRRFAPHHFQWVSDPFKAGWTPKNRRSPVQEPAGFENPTMPCPDPGALRGPFKGSRGPFTGPRGPLKRPRGPLKGPRCPFKGPRGTFKGPRGPFKGPRGPFNGFRTRLGPVGPPKIDDFQTRSRPDLKTQQSHVRTHLMLEVWPKMFGPTFPGYPAKFDPPRTPGSF